MILLLITSTPKSGATEEDSPEKAASVSSSPLRRTSGGPQAVTASAAAGRVYKFTKADDIREIRTSRIKVEDLYAILQGSVFDQPHPAVFPSIAINAHLVHPAYAWLWRTPCFNGSFRPSSALRYLRPVRRTRLEIYRKKAQASMETATCYQIWKGKFLVMGLSGKFRYSRCR